MKADRETYIYDGGGRPSAARSLVPHGIWIYTIEMYENFRLFFSILWLVASGCLLAAGFAVLISWGSYLDYFYSVLGIWCIASVGAVVTSL